MNSKAVMKSIWRWSGWQWVGRTCKWPLLAWVIIYGLSSCTMGWIKMNAVTTYVETLDPQKLREGVNWQRAQWINTCVNNGAAGVLGGATIAADAIEACKRAGFELYPEQDWAALSTANRNETYEKFLWGDRP